MAKLGLAWCFILNGFSFFAVLWALFKIKLPELSIIKTNEPILEYMLNGFNYIKQNRVIFNLMLIMAVVGIFGWSYAILFPAIAKDIFYQKESGFAMLLAINGVGALAGALFVAYIGNSSAKRKLVDYGLYLFGLMIFLLAFCKIYILSLFLVALAGMGIVVYFSSSTTIIQASVDDSIRGRVMGIWALVFGGMVPVGHIFAGTFSHFFGISFTLILSAAVCVLFTIIIKIFSVEERNILSPKEIIYDE